MRKSFFASALTAGLVAGSLDITAACIQAYLKTSTTPLQVLKLWQWGSWIQRLSNEICCSFGLLVHFIIAISFTLFLFSFGKTYSFTS
jgi:hypothetical protein